jgi:hypothetical protein
LSILYDCHQLSIPLNSMDYLFTKINKPKLMENRFLYHLYE